MPSLTEVVSRFGPSYMSCFGARMPEAHCRALARLMACRTFAAGRVYYQCTACDDWQVAAASCGHRACAQCGHHKAMTWEAAQQSRLLPVPYVMVTFTVPSQFRRFFRANQRLCYDLLFAESAGTLQEIARDPKHLGGEIGMTGVLHTWRRDLGYHPHIHYIVPAGAAGASGWMTAKLSAKTGQCYFLPSSVLAVRMRNRFRDRLRAEQPDLWKSLPPGVWKQAWNVNVQAVGRGQQAFGYLARYVQKTAITNRRIVASDDQTVTYSWIDRNTQQSRTKRVTGHEFLRRFLQHVLPKGLMRVRHFGFLSAAAKATYTQVRTWLGAGPVVVGAPVVIAATVSTSDTPPIPIVAEDTAALPDPAKKRVCCAKCQRAMEFREFRSARDPEEPAAYVAAMGAARRATRATAVLAMKARAAIGAEAATAAAEEELVTARPPPGLPTVSVTTPSSVVQ